MGGASTNSRIRRAEVWSGRRLPSERRVSKRQRERSKKLESSKRATPSDKGL
jgi:hypothetical protein